ncbi:MAG TPA: hypothetical protein PKN62_02200 [bacterium]|nr:hypothetical protein [bacterium]
MNEERDILIVGYDEPSIGILKGIINRVLVNVTIHINKLEKEKDPEIIIYELLPPRSFLTGYCRDDMLEVLRMKEFKESNPESKLIILANFPGDAIARLVESDYILEKPDFTKEFVDFLKQIA